MERRRSQWLGGIVAGLVGGVAVWIWFVGLALGGGRDIWPIFKGAARPLLGEARVTSPEFDATAFALGVVAHLGISILWGLLFAVVARGFAREITVFAGAFWGILVWIAMYYAVLPIAGASEVVAETPIWAAVVSHLIFGLGLGVGYLPFQEPEGIRVDRDAGVRP